MISALTASGESTGFWPEGVMPLARWSRFSSDNIDAVHEHMSRMFCSHQLTTEGGAPPVSFRHHQARLRAITLNATDYGNPYGRISINVPGTEEFFFVQLSLAGHAMITNEKRSFDLSPGFLCVIGGSSPAQQMLDRDYKHFTVKVSKSDLEAVLADELGYKPKGLEFLPTPVRLGGDAAAFAHLIRTICDDIDGGLTAYTHPRVYDAVEEMLKRLLLAAVPHNYSDLFNTAARGPAPYYLRRVEEYIHEHATEAISLSDLIDAAGVSGRSLHSSFRRFRDDTPMGYLKKYRLDLAHRQLKTGVEQGLTVTEVAFASGFTHLSKFARDYFERFNERPSSTLKRMGRA